MHTRDNRRPHYYAQRDHTDVRPCLEWRIDDGVYFMFIGEELFAEVRPVGDPDYNEWGDVISHRHDAILRKGPDALSRKAFDDLSQAKAFCELYFA